MNEGTSNLIRLGLILLSSFLIVGGAIAGGRWFAGWIGELGVERAPDVPPGQPVEVVVPTGASGQQIGDLLASLGVVDSSAVFEEAARTAEATEDLKAGTYQLTTGMDPSAVVAALVEGPFVETYWITVPEGLRVEEIMERIATQSSMSVAELTSALSSGRVQSSLRPPDAGSSLASWEGLLFPDTYQLARNWTAEEVLTVMARTIEERYAAVEWSQGPAAELTPTERLVVASIIESETRLDRDRPLVARVIFNRIDAGMPLQIDATVLYAIGVRGRSPTAQELETESPYNTYLFSGLPPTPISAPGAAALVSVAEPAEGDYLYFVLTGADGSHSFTSDYEEFLRWRDEAREQGLF